MSNQKPKIRFPFVGEFPITFKFGASPDWYIKVTGYPHNGVDFGCPKGSAILACDDGRILYADNVPDSDGLGINIGHDWGLSQYWHLSKLTARYGQEVKKGDCIGLSGDTGWATGPHLHFGIKVKEDTVPGMKGWTDPLKYFIGSPVPIPVLPVVLKYHRVRLGESLWSIALKYYGEGWYWPRIFKANEDKIKNPSLIFPFQKLLIP